MSFFENLAFQNGDGTILCRSKKERTYWTATTKNEHQCPYCGKTIRAGRMVVTDLKELGVLGMSNVMAHGRKEAIEQYSKTLYCSLDCFRKAN